MKALYVSTVSSTMNAFLIPHIKMLVENSYQVDVAFNVNKPLKNELKNLVTNIFEVEFNRKPQKNNYIRLVRNLREIILKGDYDIVHTHTPIASTVARLACKNLKNVRVIYTAHGFHFYDGAPLVNWLLYYPVEKWLSNYTDTLITINKEDYNRSKRFSSNENIYVPGVGVDLSKYKNSSINISEKRKELGIPDEAFVILSVGEINKNKNHETVIRALTQINNDSIYYIIAGRGNCEDYLRSLIIDLNLEKRVKLLGFRNDIAELHKISNVFAFPSKREGLGLAALEAMASGLPLITSNIHGIKDYSFDGVTGYTFSPLQLNEIVHSINKIYELSPEQRKAIGEENKIRVQKYDISNILEIMKEII